MSLSRCKAAALNSVSLTLMLLGTAFSAQAQERLSILNDTFNVSVSSAGFGPVAGLISNTGNGSVGAISGVPTTGTLTVPAFSFTLVEAGVTNEVKTFNAAIIISENSSQRRLEVYIPGISMDFSGAGLVGTLTNPTVKIYGRDTSGAITAAASVASGGSVAFSGSSISFDAAGQITLIQNQGGVLADIVSSINNTGLGYTYKVILKQASGVAATFATANTTALPLATNNEFILDGSGAGADVDDMSGGYYLTGTLTFAASGGGGGGGGGGGSNETTATTQINEASDATNALANQITSGGVTESTVTNFSTIVTNTNATATLVGSGLADGTVSVNTGISLINTLSSQMRVSQQISGAQTEVPAATIQAIVNNAAKVFAGLKGKVLQSTELLQLRTALTTLFTDAGGLLDSFRGQFGLLSNDPLVAIDAINSTTAVTDIGSIIDELETTLNNALEIPGFEITIATFNSIQSASQVAMELLLGPVGTQLGLNIAYLDDTSTRTLLSSNTTLMSRLLDSASIDLGKSTSIVASNLQPTLEAAGLATAFAGDLSSNLTNFVRANSLTVDSGSGALAVSTSLTTALGASSLSVNALTGVVSYVDNGFNFTALLKAVLLAPSALPTGTFTLPDGSKLLVANNLAYVLVPSAHDIVEFATAINTVGTGLFSTAITANGSIALTETASGVVFNGTISNSSNTSGTAVTSTTFGAPTGDPANTSYLFTIQFIDGTKQNLLPAISDTAFYQSVANAGFGITTNRGTGIITIDSFTFRPDYFITPLTAADTTFHAANADTSGVAYRAVDANGDGKTDYQVITSAGVQTVYGLQ